MHWTQAAVDNSATEQTKVTTSFLLTEKTQKPKALNTNGEEITRTFYVHYTASE